MGLSGESNSGEVISGSGSSLNADILNIDTTYLENIFIQLTGVFSASLTFQGSNDGVNWSNVLATDATDVSKLPFSSVSATGIYIVPANFSNFRLRITSYTSGTVNATALITENNPLALPNKKLVTIAGGSDGTQIGNVGDKLKVDANFSGTVITSPNGIDITKLIPIGYGASLTVPLFPTIKPLGHYTVPSGKSFKLFGLMFKTAGSSNYLHAYTRTLLWKFNAVPLATPAIPTLTAKTISGSGLATLSTYKYKIVANNSIGNTSPSPEATITLTGTQNAVTLSWTNVTGAFDYNIYRTAANGAAGTQKLVSTTDQLAYTDVLADSDLDIETPPSSTPTSGNFDVESYMPDYGTTQVVLDTMSPISTPTPLDIIYKNLYGEKTYISTTPAAAAGGQVVLQLKGVSNPLDSKRIKKGVPGKNKKRIYDVGINDILSVGNTPATGEFMIYGHNHFYHMASQQSNKWDTQLFPVPMIFPASSEIIFGISGNAASTSTARHDVILLGTLEE